MALMSCSSTITPGYAVAQWLGIRLQMLGVAMVVGVAFIAVLEHHFSTVDPGTLNLGNYLLPTLCGFPLSTMYSRNFQGRKLSRISRSCGYSRKFSLQSLEAWHLLPAPASNLQKFSFSKVSRYVIPFVAWHSQLQLP